MLLHNTNFLWNVTFLCRWKIRYSIGNQSNTWTLLDTCQRPLPVYACEDLPAWSSAIRGRSCEECKPIPWPRFRWVPRWKPKGEWFFKIYRKKPIRVNKIIICTASYLCFLQASLILCIVTYGRWKFSWKSRLRARCYVIKFKKSRLSFFTGTALVLGIFK